MGHCSYNPATAVAKRANILMSQVGVFFHPVQMTGPGSVLGCVVVVSQPRYASHGMNKNLEAKKGVGMKNTIKRNFMIIVKNLWSVSLS